MMVQTNISIPQELHEAITKYGYKHKLSMSAVIRRALDNFLEYNAPPDLAVPSLPEDFHQPDVPQVPFLEPEVPSEPTEPVFGVCDNCDRRKEITAEEYLDDDQIRTTGNLCAGCKSEAKRSGRLK